MRAIVLEAPETCGGPLKESKGSTAPSSKRGTGPYDPRCVAFTGWR